MFFGSMSFKEALEKKIIGEGDRIYIPRELFPKRNERVTLTLEETGCNEDQIFDMEDLEWVFHYDEQGMPAFFGGATSKRMYLKGEVGYSHGICSQNKICEMYSNPELWNSRTITMEEGEKYRNECDYTNTWLGTTGSYISIKNAFEIHAMHYIDENRCVSIAPLSQKPFQYDFYKCLRIGPVLQIKVSKIFVETKGKKRERYWRIFQK